MADQNSPAADEIFQKICNVVAAARKKPPRFVGAPGFVLIYGEPMIDEEAGGRRGKNRKGEEKRQKKELKA